ncbi:MAG: acylneuraminate cytidylyltransferase family protein [Dysgonamonadaceae bacterium]|jgi:CMP-N-acetylneuraminic acid synthetase|nr:acylneuraminate cytidylyltransferase family protein [Dysgonamonadaceae bacterium]
MKLIAMIPARLGSKRIPRKNIRIIGGKPLIRHAVDLAVSSGEFAEVWVNSESEQLGRIAAEAGANFHRRPEHLASDAATNRDFTTEFLESHPCDYVVMVNTTSPLLRHDTLRRFCSRLRADECDTLLSTLVLQAETFYHGAPLNFPTTEKINSQLLPPVEYVVWALTGWKRDCFLSLQKKAECPVFGGRLTTFAIPKDESCDLDTEEDWRIAEGIMEARGKNRKAEYYDF